MSAKDTRPHLLTPDWARFRVILTTNEIDPLSEEAKPIEADRRPAPGA